VPASQAATAQSPKSVSELIQRIRSDYPANQPVWLRFAETVLQVLTNSAEVAADLEDYFAPFLCQADAPDIQVTAHQAPEINLALPFQEKPPEPGKTKVKEAYSDLPDGRIVRKTQTGICCAFDSRDALIVGPCREHLNQVVNFVNHCYVRPALQSGAVLGHAAGVAFGEKGLALAGASGSGKSTLALKLLDLGGDFVSNDRLVILRGSSGLVMRGLAKHPRVNPGTLLTNPGLRKLLSQAEQQELSSLPHEALWQLERKYDVPIHRVFGSGRFRLQAGLQALIILNWSPDSLDGMRIVKVDPERNPELLTSFMKTPGVFLEMDSSRLEAVSIQDYQQFMQSCPVYEISGGVDFNGAARVCQEALGQGS